VQPEALAVRAGQRGGPVKLGVVFPTCDIGDDPVAIRDYAQAAEELGYDHLLVYDHVLGAVHAGREPPLQGPYGERDAFHEPFVLFGYLAAATRRIGLATGVLVLPQRQTALVAKQAAEIDLLSGGRLRLGVGVGWNPVEYQALGQAWEGRGRRLGEQVALLRRLWSEPVLDFVGEFHRVDRAGLLPRPRRAIPIWFGGMTPVAVRRAARLGDGFVFGSASRPMQALCERLHAEARAAGREQPLGVETILPYGAGPERWHERVETWRRLGVTHVSLRAMDRGVEGLREPASGVRTAREHIATLEPFVRALR
jgi:probable F420-dependent oxidoreductase